MERWDSLTLILQNKPFTELLAAQWIQVKDVFCITISPFSWQSPNAARIPFAWWRKTHRLMKLYSSATSPCGHILTESEGFPVKFLLKKTQLSLSSWFNLGKLSERMDGNVDAPGNNNSNNNLKPQQQHFKNRWKVENVRIRRSFDPVSAKHEPVKTPNHLLM